MFLDFDHQWPYPFNSGFASLPCLWAIAWSIKLDFIFAIVLFFIFGLRPAAVPLGLIGAKIAYLYIPPIVAQHVFYLIYGDKNIPPLCKLLRCAARPFKDYIGTSEAFWYDVYLKSYMAGTLVLVAFVSVGAYLWLLSRAKGSQK